VAEADTCFFGIWLQ